MFTKIYKKNGVKLLDANNLKLSMLKNLVHGSKEKELIIGTNDEEVLIALARDKTLKTTYLRITYKKKRIGIGGVQLPWFSKNFRILAVRSLM